MTIIAPSPTPEVREWSFSDSATFDDFLGAPSLVPTSETISPPAIEMVSVEVRHSRKQEPHAMEWLYPTLRAMAALPWWTDNWGSGATRTQIRAMASMLEILVAILDSQAPPPAVVPTWNGGVQVEWHRSGIDLEIEVDPAGNIEYFFKSPDEECEGRSNGDFSQLSEYARAVIER